MADLFSAIPALDIGGPFLMLGVVVLFALAIVILYGIMLKRSFNVPAEYFKRRGETGYEKVKGQKLKVGRMKDGSPCLIERSDFIGNILGKNRKLPPIDYSKLPRTGDLDLYWPSPDECYPLSISPDGKIEPQINAQMKQFYYQQAEEDKQWLFNSSFWTSPAGMVVILGTVGIIMVIALAVWSPEAAKAASYAASASADARWIYEMNYNLTNGSLRAVVR
jgi:uncharacterized membrane protein